MVFAPTTGIPTLAFLGTQHDSLAADQVVKFIAVAQIIPGMPKSAFLALQYAAFRIEQLLLLSYDGWGTRKTGNLGGQRLDGAEFILLTADERAEVIALPKVVPAVA